MNWRYVLLTMLLVAGIMQVSAQAKIAFNEKVHDFGYIQWNVPATVEFVVTNTGDKPLVLTNVTTSCGCTVAGWTKEPIAPGEKGYVRSTFDAKAVGRFHKTVGVYCNAADKPVYLAIRGTVSMELKNYDAYPIRIGRIRIDRNEVEFPDAEKGDNPTVELKVANTSDNPYEPVLMHLPSYLKAEYLPERIEKDRTGIIRLTLETDKLKNLGLNQTSVYLARYPGDKVGDENELVVSSVLLPDFSRLTERERLNAPSVVLSADELDMVVPEGKDKITRKVTVTNVGKSRLEIQALQVFNPAVSVSLKKRNIDPGASTTLKVTLHADLLKRQKTPPRVLMITNDPAHPKVLVEITTGKQ